MEIQLKLIKLYSKSLLPNVSFNVPFLLVTNSSRNDAYNVCCPYTFQFYNYLDVIYGEVRRKHPRAPRLSEGDGFPTSKRCLMEFLWAAVNILTWNNEDIWQWVS